MSDVLADVIDLCRDAVAVAATPVPADVALARLCRAVPAKAWHPRRKVGWGRTHYGDPYASDTSGNRYELRPGLTIDAPDVREIGGQNSGGYEISDSGLRVEPDGSLWHVTVVDGSWSQWQGSSSGYTLIWGRYSQEYDLTVVVASIRDMVSAYRDRCQSRRATGAAEAAILMAALDAAGL